MFLFFMSLTLGRQTYQQLAGFTQPSGSLRGAPDFTSVGRMCAGEALLGVCRGGVGDGGDEGCRPDRQVSGFLRKQYLRQLR